jgi:hypothetical protein
MKYCPTCGGEYVDGVVECRDCGVPLVATPPAPVEAPPDTAELVTVLETGDPAEIAFVQSLFAEEGIPFFVQGDGVQDLFGVGRVGGFNVLTGPARIQVPRENAEAATELLRDMPNAERVTPDPLPEDVLPEPE